jgi:hypothetical protein
VEAAAHDNVVRNGSPSVPVHLECHRPCTGTAKSGQRRHR